jgi:serine/threonine-protein kinase
VKSLTSAVPVTYVAKAQKLTDDSRVNNDLLIRFTREANTLQKLGNAHGQIPSLFDFFEFEGNFYLIQEYIKGQNLLDVLITKAKNNQIFSEKEIIEITLSLLEVLIQVHNQGVIHRDIKHQNIILREGDNKPVLIDFGIIKDAANYNPSQTGTIIGTPGYCPLEQATGHVMFQSDLYAVGMVALVSLTGIPAHGFQIAPNPLVSPQKSRVILDDIEKYISPPLLDWLKQSLEVLPQNRFASAEEMREALLNIYNLEYIAKGAKIAREIDQEKMDKMEQEIARLKEQLKASGSGNKKPRKQAEKEDYNPGSVVEVVQGLEQIITTQKEVNGFNIIKRILKDAGLDSNRLEIKDTMEYCGINIDGDEKKTLIRLYFNDEDNLSFALVLANGKEERFSIKTLRGIAPKKEQIIARAKELIGNKNKAKSQPSSPKNNVDDLLKELESKFGSK